MNNQGHARLNNCTGEVLQEELARRNWNVPKLARLSGVPQHTIYTWIIRKSAPRSDWKIESVARVLGLDMSYVLYGVSEEVRNKVK